MNKLKMMNKKNNSIIYLLNLLLISFCLSVNTAQAALFDLSAYANPPQQAQRLASNQANSNQTSATTNDQNAVNNDQGTQTKQRSLSKKARKNRKKRQSTSKKNVAKIITSDDENQQPATNANETYMRQTGRQHLQTIVDDTAFMDSHLPAVLPQQVIERTGLSMAITRYWLTQDLTKQMLAARAAEKAPLEKTAPVMVANNTSAGNNQGMLVPMPDTKEIPAVHLPVRHTVDIPPAVTPDDNQNLGHRTRASTNERLASNDVEQDSSANSESTATPLEKVRLQLVQEKNMLFARLAVSQPQDRENIISVIWQAPPNSGCSNSRYSLEYAYTEFHTRAYRTLKSSNSTNAIVCSGLWTASVVNDQNQELARASLMITDDQSDVLPRSHFEVNTSQLETKNSLAADKPAEKISQNEVDSAKPIHHHGHRHHHKHLEQENSNQDLNANSNQQEEKNNA